MWLTVRTRERLRSIYPFTFVPFCVGFRQKNIILMSQLTVFDRQAIGWNFSVVDHRVRSSYRELLANLKFQLFFNFTEKKNHIPRKFPIVSTNFFSAQLDTQVDIVLCLHRCRFVNRKLAKTKLNSRICSWRKKTNWNLDSVGFSFDCRSISKFFYSA